MKKILYITTSSCTINSFLVQHIKMLVEQGYVVDCAANLDYELNIDINQELHDIGVKFYELPFNRNPLSGQNFKAFKLLVKIQEENQYDIIHVHTPIASVYGRLLKIKFTNIKTIYTVHGFHFYKGAPKVNWMIYYPIEKIMAKFTDIAITINSEDYEMAKKLGIKEVHSFNGVGVDLNIYSPKLYDRKTCREKFNINEDDFVVAMIAEVNKNKNHNQMINAVEKLIKDDKPVKVLCAGDGDLIDDIKKDISNKNLDDVIQMLGFRTDINEIITCADIGLLMSYREGLPRNIMELMAFGKPVIGTNIRGIRDLIHNGKNGFLVDIEDYEKTANAIDTLYEDRELLLQMGNDAYQSIQKYSIDNVINQLKEVY